jgi:uncharacterized membrane protein YeaQ/YmgE (transglycosylase-associated protein family)
MEVLAWILVGIIVGMIGKLLLKDYSDVPWMVTIMLGIIGAVAGGFLSATLGLTSDNRGEFGPIGTTITGAVGVLLINKIFEKY